MYWISGFKIFVKLEEKKRVFFCVPAPVVFMTPILKFFFHNLSRIFLFSVGFCNTNGGPHEQDTGEEKPQEIWSIKQSELEEE